MYPLIYSPGPDEAGNAGTTSGYGLATATNGWPPESLPNICEFSDGATLIGLPDPANPTAYRDNITKVSAADIKRVANRLLDPKQMAIFVVGDWDTISVGNARATMAEVNNDSATQLPLRDPMTMQPMP